MEDQCVITAMQRVIYVGHSRGWTPNHAARARRAGANVEGGLSGTRRPNSFARQCHSLHSTTGPLRGCLSFHSRELLLFEIAIGSAVLELRNCLPIMNGYQDHRLDEDAFGPSKGNLMSSFDAFRGYCS